MIGKQKLLDVIRRVKEWPLRTKLLVVFGIFAAAYCLVFFLPKPVAFTYSGQDCARQLTFFPGIMRQAGESGYDVTFEDRWEIGGFALTSLRTCFTAVEKPDPGTTIVAVAPWGGIAARKHFTLQVPEPPTATTSDFVGQTLPVTRPVEISLSGPDEVFDYQLKIGEKAAGCDHEAATLRCDIVPLDLEQGAQYQAELLRSFGGDKEKIGGGDIKTLRALVLSNASVSEGQTVYDRPKSFQFEYDKPLSKVTAELKMKEGEELKEVRVTTGTDGKKAVVTSDEELARNHQYALTLTAVEAEDGSAIPDPFTVNFTMSGGPKVVQVNVGSTGAPTAGTVVLTLDQEVANVDKLTELVSIKGVAAAVSKSGKQLLIQYSAGRCVGFSVSIKKGLESEHGVAQQEDWALTTRTQCYAVQTIGYSEQGRAINAYSFGSGGKTILYTGAIHGNELGTRSLMYAWIDELDAGTVPAGTRIVVIPVINPDGAAAGSRYNANTVDLNRNFNTTDWKKDIETPYNEPLPGGGGESPASEAETQVLANYTAQLRPALTLSFHSVAGYVIANTCGNSPSYASTYARLTGYRNMTGVSGAFAYEITGTYDDWICQRLGLPSILIELASSTSSEFSRNRSALWAMTRI